MVDQVDQVNKDFIRFSEMYHPENEFRIPDKMYHLPWKELSQDTPEALIFYEKGLSILYGQTQEDKKMYPAAKWDDLSDAISRLLKSSSEKHKDTPAAKEIRHIGIAYKNNMEKFLMKMDELMKYSRNMNTKLLKSLREFIFVSRGTAGIILGSSIANFAVMFGSLIHKIFGFPWSSKALLIPTVTGALTFTTSLLSFTYMSQTTSDFAKDLNKEDRLLRDVIETHRKGDWIDEEVSNLFPYGINVNITDFKKVNTLKMTPLLKIYLCSKIIYSNVKRNKTLLENEEFLIKVKLFVESPAAEIWWSRMKIKILLEELRQKANETSAKQFLSGHENLIYRTALYVYPVVIPWLFISRAPKEMKFIFATLAGLLSALEFGEDGSDELDDLKKMYENYENDFRKIYNICKILDDEDYYEE